MNHGFIKVAAATPKITVANPSENKKEILRLIVQCAGEGAALIVLPELCITGYTCGDLFLQKPLLEAAKKTLLEIADETSDIEALIMVGLPFAWKGKLYNTAAVLWKGEVLGIVPKRFLPNYNEFYEARHFSPGPTEVAEAALGEKKVPFGTNLLFTASKLPELSVAIELCEDLWTPNPPSISHALAGASVIANLSASDETIGKAAYRKQLVAGQSARLLCAYVYASAGDGESTQDVVYSGHNLIAENGTVLAESNRFTYETITTEIDVERLSEERRRMSTFHSAPDGYREIFFDLPVKETTLSRYVDPAPFVPADRGDRDRRCAEILAIQANGLKKRLEHTHAACAVIGISGGLDSTLALLVTVKAFDLLGLDRKGILAVTMPGFGTTDRTYTNALRLIESLGATLKEVSIANAVRIHFSDIGQEESVHDVTYENSQARERTQILMDLANKENGLVIGTGDMSELALGWATYNGDHMSMYGVNASVPKTLVRHLVSYYADTCDEKLLSATLHDVLDTPVSPELLPPKDGEIAQKTEDIVGPYELHDFYLYYLLRFGFSPKKIYRLANIAFDGTYSKEVQKKWLKTFFRRFFSQQFKRSCLPDGPKVGTVAVSPRGDLRMPSDASACLWLEEIEEI